MGLVHCSSCNCQEDSEVFFRSGVDVSASASSSNHLELSLAPEDNWRQAVHSSLSPRRKVVPIGINALSAGPSGKSATSFTDTLRLCAFGSDCLQAKAIEVPWTKNSNDACCICLSPQERGESLWQLCSNLQCRGLVCRSCIGTYVSMKLEEALHFVPTLRCPECRCRISTSAWEPFATSATLTRHTANAEALLSIRCGICDETGSLLHKFEITRGAAERENEVFGSVAPIGTDSRQMLRLVWRSFCAAECNGEDVVSALVKCAEDAGLDSQASTPGLAPARLRRLLDSSSQLVADIERRVALQLAILKKFPMIRTRCCGQKICFNCKVSGWHAGVSCETRQQRFVLSSDAAGIQYCPLCRVPIQKTEGCNEVRCVCGHSWNWLERGGELPGGVPLICFASNLPAGGADLLKHLLRFSADPNAVSYSGWNALHYAAAPRRRKESHHQDRAMCFPSRSDDSRIKVLLDSLQTSGKGSELVNATDTAGDTCLSIAIAHDNVAAAEFLVQEGAGLNAEVLSSLKNCTSPRAGLRIGSVLRRAISKLEPCPGLLWLYVQLGLPVSVESALEIGAQLDEDAASSLILLRLACSGNFSTPSILDSSSEVEGILLSHAQKHAVPWVVLKSSGATSLMRREIRGATNGHREFDISTLKILLQEQADPNASLDLSSSHDGKISVPIVAIVAGADMQVQSGSLGVALQLLLEASASANIPDSGNDPPLWWALHRANPNAVELLVEYGALWPSTIAITARRLANQLQDITTCAALRRIANTLTQILPTSALKRDESDDSLQSCIRIIFPQHESGRVDEAFVAMVFLLSSGVGNVWRVRLDKLKDDFEKNGGSAQTWQELLARVATAVLLKEIRSSNEEERDLNIELVEELLKSRADPNARQQSSSLFKEYWGQENCTPLMLLACSRNLPVSSARNAVELLLSFRAEVDLVDEDGDNALALAVMKQSANMVPPLVAAGASISQSLIEDPSYFAAISHPDVQSHIIGSISQSIHTFLKDISNPPLWALVQFGAFDEIQLALKRREAIDVDVTVVEAFLRRYIYFVYRSTSCAVLHGRDSASALSECEQIKAHLQHISSFNVRENWLSLEREAATRVLRSEVTGALEGRYDIDMSVIQLLLEHKADPNLQIRDDDIDGDEDDNGFDEEDDSRSEWESSESDES